VAEPLPWRDAWHDALYGPRGAYRGAAGPAGHFTTSSHGPLGAVLAEAVARLADREGATHLVDVGAGRGELLSALHAIRPDLGLTGLDVVTRPAALPKRVEWVVSPGGAALPDALQDLGEVLVLAHEWLDVVPCTVAEVDAPGHLATVLVDPDTGVESLGGELDDADLAWCARYWAADALEVGDRVEVGRARDDAWSALVSRVRRGALLAVDYGHAREDRPPRGTLTGYSGGTVVPPVPDGSCDITAHVAVDALEHDELTTQREALHQLGLTPGTPPLDLSRTDPAAYLGALARSAALTALTETDGLGGFAWVLRRVGTTGPHPADAARSRPPM
jgi:SAM-dependent MidA family methyltransferase